MERYSEAIEARMQQLYDSLSEKDSRRYASVEAAKLGHGGIEYVAELFGCDPKTIERGFQEVEQLPLDPAGSRVRKKGAGARQLAFRNRVLSRLRKRKSKKKSRVLP
jgi:hypothetical protein